MGPWPAARQPDVICLQEVRAPDDVVVEAMGPGWHGVHAESEAKGRAGVAVFSRVAPVAVRVGLGLPEFAAAGRWVEADLPLTGDAPSLLTVVSV